MKGDLTMKRVFPGAIAMGLGLLLLASCGQSNSLTASPAPSAPSDDFTATSSTPNTGRIDATGESPESTVSISKDVVGSQFDTTDEAGIRSALRLMDGQVIGAAATYGNPFEDGSLTTVHDVQNSRVSSDPGRGAEGSHSLVISEGTADSTKRTITSVVDINLGPYQTLSFNAELCRIGDIPAHDVLAVIAPEVVGGKPQFTAERWNAVRAWAVANGKIVEIESPEKVNCGLAGE